MKSNLKLKLREEQLLWLPGTDMERGRSLVLEAAAALASGCAGFSDCSKGFESCSGDFLDCSGVSRHSCEAWEKTLWKERLLEGT